MYKLIDNYFLCIKQCIMKYNQKFGYILYLCNRIKNDFNNFMEELIMEKDKEKKKIDKFLSLDYKRFKKKNKDLSKKEIKIANMLPEIFIPMIFPVICSLFSKIFNF